jgi:hypothetical protein
MKRSELAIVPQSIYTQTYTCGELSVYKRTEEKNIRGEKRREEGKGKAKQHTKWFDYSSASTVHETFAYVHAFL